LRPGQRGVCKVRFNSDGTLLVHWQYVAGFQNDPIEKKLFFMLSRKALGCWGAIFTVPIAKTDLLHKV
jgi:hypothetical protein